MNRHHLRTLEALFAHPLRHGVRSSQVEALFRALGADVTLIDDRRLRLRMPDGQETWIHTGCGRRQPDLDADAVLRVRQFLRESGITPEHPAPLADGPRGDQSRRLVLHLDHHHTDVFRLDGEEVDHAVLRPHGIWGSGETLTHRHDRDLAGQRAPRDNDYLARITAAMADVDTVLLLGHGTGESDMRQVLLDYLGTHRRDLIPRIVGVVTLQEGGLGEDGLLALAREHFGNVPHRRPLHIPGQEINEG
ncbi:MAG: hypothetical protein VKM34_01875 [Cyanobacteriota bacterium]|nr:hypothetical protein [Cyanobacteriota bacterium]